PGALAPAGRVVTAGLAHVDGVGAGIGDGARGLRQRLHGQEIALDVGVVDDGRHALALIARGLALPALPRVGERLLIGRLGNGHALHADGEAGIVHHGEHAGQPAVLLADQPADGARLPARYRAVAIDHGAGGRGVDAELVLDGGAECVVALAQRTIR